MNGRPPKPTHLKILSGNPGRRPLNEREAKPRSDKPTCPSWLSVEAKKVWRATVKEIDGMGLLASADKDAIIVLVHAVVLHREACEIVQRSGILIRSRDGGLVKNPACQIVRDMSAVVVRVAAEFGMTPSSRSRIQMPAQADDELARRYFS